MLAWRTPYWSIHSRYERFSCRSRKLLGAFGVEQVADRPGRSAQLFGGALRRFGDQLLSSLRPRGADRVVGVPALLFVADSVDGRGLAEPSLDDVELGGADSPVAARGAQRLAPIDRSPGGIRILKTPARCIRLLEIQP